MKMRVLLLSMVSLYVLLLATSCEPKDPDDPNDGEVITEMTLILTADDGSGTAEFKFVDEDGNGANPAVITSTSLVANTSYTGAITLASPDEDITIEIKEEDDDHQFFYEIDVAGVSASYADEDGDMNPVGLATTWTTGDAGSGKLVVTLRHEPVKTANGVSDGLIANAGGETDIEVIFDLNVE